MLSAAAKQQQNFRNVVDFLVVVIIVAVVDFVNQFVVVCICVKKNFVQVKLQQQKQQQKQ